jgi:hypothetical protein
MKINEFIETKTPVQQAIEEHVARGVPFRECIFRPGSTAFREFYRTVRDMHSQGLLELDWEDQELLETSIGELVRINGEIVPLDVPFVEFTEPMARQAVKTADASARALVQFHNKMDAKMANTPSIANTQQYKDYKKGNQQRKTAAMKQGMPYGRQDGPGTGANSMPGGALKPIPGLNMNESEYEYTGDYHPTVDMARDDDELNYCYDCKLISSTLGEIEVEGNDETTVVCPRCGSEAYVVASDDEIAKYASIGEAEYQGKKVKLNSPKRGGSKKFYVYVKNPKTGRVKKISWGDTTGLSVKAKNKGAVKSFVARHKCKQANDKMTARYWSCRTPRYKSLGVKGGQWW